jgi:hypothetical protein
MVTALRQRLTHIEADVMELQASSPKAALAVDQALLVGRVCTRLVDASAPLAGNATRMSPSCNSSLLSQHAP